MYKNKNIVSINVILQLGAFFKAGAITRLSMFVRKSYLEAFDRKELSNTQKKERCLKGELSSSKRSYRGLCSEKTHSKMSCPPVYPTT